MATTITAGDLSNPAIISSDTTGAVVIQTGAAGSKVDALTISAAGVVKPLDSAWPAFRAYQSSVQTFPATTFTKILFQSEIFDTASAFDSTTNYRFQPQVAGYYQVNATYYDITALYQISVCKNGSANVVANSAYASQSGCSVSTLVYLNGSTDYLEVYYYGAARTSTQTNDGSTTFSGALVRAA